MEVAADTEDDRVEVVVADIVEVLLLPVEVADIAEVLLAEVVVVVDIAVGALQVAVGVDIADLPLVEVAVDIRDEVARVIQEVPLDTVDHQAVVLAGATMEDHLHLDQVKMDTAAGALQVEVEVDIKDHLDLEDMNPEKVHLEAHLEKVQVEDIEEIMGDISPMTEIARVAHHVETMTLASQVLMNNI